MTSASELVINLYCPGSFQCEIQPCGHGPNWAQKPFSDSVLGGKYESVLGLGGFGSGKTSEIVRLAIEFCIRFPGNRVLLGRRYSVDFEGSVQPQIDEILNPALILKYPTKKEPYYILRSSGDTPSRLYCGGLYGTNRKRIGKFLGSEYGAIFIDQAEELSYDDHLFLKGRLRHKVPVRVLVYIANPPNVGHWLHTTFELERHQRSVMMHSLPTAANQKNLPPDYISRLTQDYKDRPGWLKCYLEGTWGYTVLGDPALAGFRDGTHILKMKYDPTRIIFRAWDFGWKHPAVGWYQLKENGGAHKFAEDMGDKILIRDYARHIVTRTNLMFPSAQVRDLGDHAGNQANDKENLSSIDILKKEFSIKVETKPNPSIDGTLVLMQKYISMLGRDGSPCYTVDPECRITIDGLQGGYCRDDKGQVIKDGFFEHIMDDDRYLFHHLFASESDSAKAARQMKIRTATYGFSGGAQ